MTACTLKPAIIRVWSTVSAPVYSTSSRARRASTKFIEAFCRRLHTRHTGLLIRVSETPWPIFSLGRHLLYNSMPGTVTTFAPSG